MSNKVFAKIVKFMNYVEKYCRAEQTTDDTTMHAHCVLDT